MRRAGAARGMMALRNFSYLTANGESLLSAAEHITILSVLPAFYMVRRHDMPRADIITRIWSNDLCATKYEPHVTHHPFITRKDPGKIDEKKIIFTCSIS